MTILELYKSYSDVPDLLNKFVSIGSESYGAMFKVLNTNFRSLATFNKSFEEFYNMTNGIPRDQWGASQNTGEELAKHYVTRMLQGKLFSKSAKYFYLTEKGKVFGQVKDIFSSEEERWIINFMMLLDSYFDYHKNYFVDIASGIFENYEKAGYNFKELISIIEVFLRRNPKYCKDAVLLDYTYLDSFYGDVDFLKFYRNSNEVEKDELKSYIATDYVNHRFDTIITKKFKTGGVMTLSTLKSNAFILLLMCEIIDYRTHRIKDIPMEIFYRIIVDRYACIQNSILPKEKTVDADKIMMFISGNRMVFEAIYNNLVMSEDLDDIPEDQSDTQLETTDEHYDETDAKQQKKVRQTSSVLKRLSKEQSNYRCAGEDMFNCDVSYFTSKESNKTYLEVHHLIPHEFGNDFECSIEILENYVPLCPHCHRLIHCGTDRERKPLLNSLFKKRVEKLAKHGVLVDMDKIYAFYHIDTNSKIASPMSIQYGVNHSSKTTMSQAADPEGGI